MLLRINVVIILSELLCMFRIRKHAPISYHLNAAKIIVIAYYTKFIPLLFLQTSLKLRFNLPLRSLCRQGLKQLVFAGIFFVYDSTKTIQFTLFFFCLDIVFLVTLKNNITYPLILKSKKESSYLNVCIF